MNQTVIIYSLLFIMTVSIAIGVYFAVHMIGVLLVRVFGNGYNLFGRKCHIPKVPELRLSAEFADFVETHSFWETNLDGVLKDIDEGELYAIFWNEARQRAA